MVDYGASTYGNRIADLYDDLYDGTMDTGATVELLAGLAGTGRALELGIGTGRVALPLAARGVPVEGIDASAAMVEQLRRKPGGAGIPVTLGDFADVAVDGSYRLFVLDAFVPDLSRFAMARPWPRRRSRPTASWSMSPAMIRSPRPSTRRTWS